MLRNNELVRCDVCGIDNKPGVLRCERCNAELAAMQFYNPGRVTTFMQRIQTGLSGLPYEPPKIVDTHQYYPPDTINAQYIKDNFTVWQISVGIGMNMGSRYIEQIEKARALDIPVILWHIPHANYGMAEQVQEVFSWPYVKEYTFCMDIEKPNANTPVISETKFKQYAQEIERHTTNLPMVYSSEWILKYIFGSNFPSWYQYWHWIAQYIYQSYPYLYEYFAPFISAYGCQLPFSVRNSSLFQDPVHRDSVVEWQFTHKGKEPFVYPGGPLSRDLSLGIMPAEELLREVVHYLPEDPQKIDIKDWVQLHAQMINAEYLNNKLYYDDLAGWMKANHLYPSTVDKSIVERHIIELTADNLGIPFTSYLYKGIVNTSKGLNVRNAPSQNASVLRALPYLSEVTIYKEHAPGGSDPYVWGKISQTKDEWCATNLNLIKKI